MKNTVIYIHGKNGSADECDFYKPLFPEYDVIGIDYKAETPWQARSEFPKLYDDLCENRDMVILIANSIGAYFAMQSLADKRIDRAFFISPIVDMERLILDMMKWSGVTERELSECRNIESSFGENLSWEYLCYVREHSIEWHIPTEMLYGENDSLTSLETVKAFVERTGAGLTVMPDGEHWFHTDEQMRFLKEWLTERSIVMRLDGFGLLVNDMGKMIRFYRDVLGFGIKEAEDTSNVYLVKDGTLFLLYGRKDFENMTSRKYEYVKGLNGHSEIALYVDTFDEVDAAFREVVSKGATPVLEPTTEPWVQRTCYIADPEGNLIEIGSFGRPFESRA